MSPADQTSFDEDVAPLLQYLWRRGLVSADARLGLVEFGSEAYRSGDNVTFSAAGFDMTAWLGTPARFELDSPAGHCGEPGGPSSSSSSSSGRKGLVVWGGFRDLGDNPGGKAFLAVVFFLGAVLAGLS